MTDEALNEVLSRVPMTRRKFVRRVVMGSAFAVPFVASFDMRTLDASAKAGNNCFAFNQASTSDGTYTLVGFTTATSPSANTALFTCYVLQNGVNVGSDSLAVTLVNYTAEAGFTNDQEGPVDFGIAVPQQLAFHASKTIHPPGYYALTLPIKHATSGVIVQPYNGSSIYDIGFSFSFTVGNDPNVLTIEGPALASGPVCG